MIIVDVETTGIIPWKHAIVSIGAINYSDPKQQFYQECRIFDGAEIDHRALEVNGFGDDEIRDPTRASLEETLAEFTDWWQLQKGQVLGGMNVGFDRYFLIAGCERSKITLPIGHRTYDLHTLCAAHSLYRAQQTLEEAPFTTNKIFHYVGLPTEPKPHHALVGAKMEAEAFSRLLEGKELLEEFRRYELPDYLIACKEES